MGYFAGLDVSLEETAICIVDDAGRIVREARGASEPEALVAFFTASGMTMERIGLEACSLTAWLHAGLTEAGLPAIEAGFNFIRLATPTTDDRRLPAVLANTSGFVYYVSITGITGAAAPDTAKVAAAVELMARAKRPRNFTDWPRR